MAIQYYLVPYLLNGSRNDFVARVRPSGSVQLAHLARRIVAQGSTVRVPDILAVWENTIQAIEAFLLEGFRVNLGGLCNFYPRLRGVFKGPTDEYDAARHRVHPGASAGARLRRALSQQAILTRVEAVRPLPLLASFEDLLSQTTNTTITPGSIGIVTGRRLNYDPDQADEGLFLINRRDGWEKKVGQVQSIRASQLVFLVPAGVPPGTALRLEVRRRCGSELRSGRLDAELKPVRKPTAHSLQPTA